MGQGGLGWDRLPISEGPANSKSKKSPPSWYTQSFIMLVTGIRRQYKQTSAR